jgi:2,3-bisphosphoglycerate-independent phosphoglycerate mutase
LYKILTKHNIKTYIHAFLDGRDVAQKSALGFLNKESDLNIATLSGRYYSMDRDNNWDRVKLAYDSIILGNCPNFNNSEAAVNASYEENITDEFIKPCKIGNYPGVHDGDALISCNFRSDRARQLSNALVNDNFDKFDRPKIKFSNKICLTPYSDELNNFYEVIFPATKVKNSLGEVLANNNLTQLRAAETEKYAHVTFFFSCGQEEEFPGENRILTKSPDVATYDLQPEMSASEVSQNLRDAINSNKYDLIIVNFANPDMVGHSGEFLPAIKACETIDKELGLLEAAILENGGQMLITADHGNIECMKDDNNQPHTCHTTNLVPFILVSQENKDKTLVNGSLKDIAPTILNLLKLPKPAEMTGKNLLS